MASRKISSLTELTTTPADGDLIQVVDVSDTTFGAGGTNKKIQYSNLVQPVPSTAGYVMLHGSFFDNSIRDVYLPFTGETEMTTLQRWNKLPLGQAGYLKRVTMRREYTTPSSGSITLTLRESTTTSNVTTNVEAVTVTPTYASITHVTFDFTSTAALAADKMYSLYLENDLNAAMGNTTFVALIQLT